MKNYALILEPGTLEVSRAPLTIRADDQSRGYGQENPALTFGYQGLVNGDTAVAVAPAISTAATAASPVGTYAITLEGGSDENYALILEPGTLEVSRAPLTIRADDQSRGYGQENPALTFGYQGLVNGDTAVAVAPAISTAATSAFPVGTYAITLEGGSDENYALILEPGTLEVSRAPLTIRADDQSRGYGQENPALTFGYQGLVNGDTAVAVAPAISTAATAASPVGTYAITLEGGSDENYALILEPGTLEVSRAPLTIRADDQSRGYGQENPALTFGYQGLVNGDTAVAVAPAISTAATAASPVGTYAITLEGGSDENYQIFLVNGTLEVTIPEISPVTALAAISGNRSVALIWQVPEKGGDLLEGYILELSRDGKEFSPIGSTTLLEFEVSDLFNNQPYWFRVRAFVLDFVGEEKIIGPIVPVAVASNESGSITLVSPGEFSTIINDEVTEVSVEKQEDSFVFNIGGVVIRLGATGESGNQLSPFEDILIIESTGFAEIGGDGFLSGSLVSVWLIGNSNVPASGRISFELPYLETRISERNNDWAQQSRLMDSQPGIVYFLGLAEVGEDGVFKGEFAMPEDIDEGIYTLQASGITESGSELSFSVGAIISKQIDSDEDLIVLPDILKELSIQEVPEDVFIFASWGDMNIISEIPTRLTVQIPGGRFREVGVRWDLDGLDQSLYARGTYNFEGELILPAGVLNLSGFKASLVVEVLPKPLPIDVTLDKSSFKINPQQKNYFFDISRVLVVDPIDNFHEIILLPEGFDNAYFEIKDEILFWSSADPVPGRTEFIIYVRVTDRDGKRA
jgi:hypothetical protein